mmetsp:Transcript_34017/g.59286  ORF Transcript_34017/g.59286 Transcript_34017/m.59286 type:complete len:239 (-) Transcript_34017:75-791(-)
MAKVLKALKSSLWEVSNPFIEPSLPRTLLLVSAAVLMLVFGNVFAACAMTFNCERFLPTISYTSAYRWHDRFAAVAFCAYACALTIFFATVYCTNLIKLSKGLAKAQLMFGLAVSFGLVLLSLFDEVESIIFLALGLHSTILGITVIGLVCWLVLQILAEPENKKFNNYASFMLSMVGFTVLEHNFGYLKTFMFSNNLEALCEWTTVLAFVMLPPVYFSLHREVECTLGSDTVKEVLK